jgi:hypothetical protein
MPDVAKKIISGKAQTTDGRAIVAIAGLKGNRSNNAIVTLDPPIIKGQSVASMEAKLDARLDEVRYYSGDSSS